VKNPDPVGARRPAGPKDARVTKALLTPNPEPRDDAPTSGDDEAAPDAASAPVGSGRGRLQRIGAWVGGIRWNRVGAVVAVAIIAVSMVVLYNVLSDIALDEIRTGLTNIPPENLVRAALFVAMAYATLTLYDWFALRTIGVRHIPYRVAAMVSFTSYTIGHNIGATAFSAGAIRWRIYSSWGLGIVDVAKICFVAGLTFWLGNATVLGRETCTTAEKLWLWREMEWPEIRAEPTPRHGKDEPRSAGRNLQGPLEAVDRISDRPTPQKERGAFAPLSEQLQQ